MTTGNPEFVLAGPGTLYVAPIGTTEPASATAALDAAWRDVGYTDGGIRFRVEQTFSPIEVDQELDPIKHILTARNASLAANLAEINRINLALALNSGANAAETGTFDLPDPGSEVAVMVLHETEEGARYLLRQCIQSEPIEIASVKGAENRTIPITFRAQKPDSAAIGKIWPSIAAATAGAV